MATVYRRNKKWWIDCFIEGERVREVGGDTKREALIKIREIKKQIKETEFKAPILKPQAKKRVGEFIDEYLAYAKANKAENTYKEDFRVLKRFLKFIKNKHLYEITPKDIEDYKVSLMEGRSAVTVNNNLKVVRAMLNKAVKWDYLERSPGHGVSPLPEQKKLPRFLTVEEIAKLLEAIPVRSRPIFYSLVKTGMRKSEALNLRWEDIDLDRKVIKVKKAKTYRPRIIPIGEKLESLLTSLPRKDGKVFEISHQQLKDDFEKGKKAAGLQWATIHILRHTFASHLVMEGASLFAVMELLGHADLRTTQIYSHLSSAHLQEAVEKLKY